MRERQQTEQKESMLPRGVNRLSLQEMRTVAISFGQHLRAGIEGKQTSLATIPTLLQPVDLTTIDPTKKALVIEMGGTNIYGGLVSVEHGTALIDGHITKPISPEKNRKYNSSEEFFAEVANDIVPLLAEKPDAVGIIWSFPASITDSDRGIDAISTANLTKEFVMPGIETTPIGDQLLEALRNIDQTVSLSLPRVVANDTAAVLIANGGNLGGIVGTGFNLAFVHNGKIYNLEAGGFSDVPQTTLTQQINQESDKPGFFLAEKQISGKYVEDLFTLAAWQEGLIAEDQKLYAHDMSSLLSYQLIKLQEKVPDILSEKGVKLQEIAATLRDRSAQLLASMIVGTIREFPEDFPDAKVILPIEGSFFGKTPGYKEAAELYAQQLISEYALEKEVAFIPVSSSGIKGAGVAALSKV